MYPSSMKTQTGAHNEATKNFKHKQGYIFAPINLFKKNKTPYQPFISYQPAACGKYIDIKALNE